MARRNATARTLDGRALRLDDVAGYWPDGSPYTVSERVIDSIRRGNWNETAAHEAGIETFTLADWLKRGTRAITAMNKRKPVSAHDRRLARFSIAVGQARAAATIDDVNGTEQLARGGHTSTVVTEKLDSAGNLIERTTRTETHPPNLAALIFRLERREPKAWGRRYPVELTGPDGGPVQVASPAAALIQDLDAMERRLSAVTVESEEVTDDA